MFALSGFLALAASVTNGAFVEIAGGGYARREISFSPLVYGVSKDVQGGTIGPCTGPDWGYVTGVGVFDASSGGNLLLYWALRAPVYVAVNGTWTDAAGTYELQFPDLSAPSPPISTLSWAGRSLVATTDNVVPVYAGVSLACSAGSFQALVSLDSGASGFAALRSPEFLGSPTAPTPPLNDSSSALATTAWVQQLLVAQDFLMGNQPIPPNAGPTSDASVTVGTTSTQILASNPARKFLLVQNPSSSAAVFIGLGAEATMGAGSIELQPNGSTLVFGSTGGFVPTDAVFAIASSPGVSLTVKVA